MRPFVIVVLGLLSCRERSPASSFDASSLPPKLVHVLVTGPAEGWFVREGPRLIEQWRTQEQWPNALVLMTGASPSLDVVPALFEGAPTAAMMTAANVAAFTAGPRDVDFGVQSLLTLRNTSGAMLLMTNVRPTAEAPPLLAPPTFAMFERSGVKLGVLGVSGLTKADGPFEAVPLEGALQTTLEAAKSQGAQVIVVMVSGCSTNLRPILEAHRDWTIDLVVASACDGAVDGRIGTSTLLHVKAGQYASLRAELGDVRALSAKVVDVATTGHEDPGAAKLRETWLQRLEGERSKTIAVLAKAPAPDETALLVATALKVTAKVDAGLFSTRSLKAPLQTGALTRGGVLDALPAFERVFLVDVPGEVLTKLVSHPDAFLSLPAKVDPNGSYVLATTEFLYRTGIGLDVVDANPVDSDLLVPTAVVSWLEAQGSDAQQPLAVPRPPQRRK